MWLHMDIDGVFTADFFSSFLGWTGSIAYLLAYLLLSINRLKADQRLYHLLNVVGAVGLVGHALFLNDYPNLAVNVAWGLIGLTTIVLLTRKKRG